MTTPFQVACIQMRSGLDRRENVEAATEMIRAAASSGAQLILTPEMTNVVDRKPRRLFEHLDGEAGLWELDHFASLADELGIVLAVGSMAVALSGGVGQDGPRKMANRSIVFLPGGGRVAYDKVHLFDVDLPTGESWKESSTVAQGDTAVVAKTLLGKLGLSVCFDVRFPHLYRTLAQHGAEILLVPAAFTVPTGQAHWETLLRARAIETGSFVMAAAQGGLHDDGRVTYGHSMIIDPWGRILAQKQDDTPGLLTAMVDLEKVVDTRTQLPALHLDRPVKTRILPQ